MKFHQTIGIMGAGRATRFLLDGWAAAAALPDAITVSDPEAAAAAGLREAHPSIAIGDTAAVARCEWLILSVHPPVLPAVCEELRSVVRHDVVVLSMAPKVRIGKIAELLGVGRVARMIPNAPSAIGRGFNPLSFGPGFDPTARAAMLGLVRPWGESPEVPEEDLEAYAILTAMGPTYLWFQWQALRELGRGFGLADADTDHALLRMIEGSAACLLSAGRDPDAVMDMVPVKPLGEVEERILNEYRDRLNALHQKLKS
jgi:pyrroline-5-carboxylate reductase